MRFLVLAGIAIPALAVAGPAVDIEGTAEPPVDPVWRLDLAGRGVGSLAIGDDPMHAGLALAPAVALRLERRAGPIAVGGAIAVALPAWSGQLDATLSADLEHALGSRWRLSLGADAGVEVYYVGIGLGDAMPPNPIAYWGPLARVRAQLAYLVPQPNGRAIGVVAGPLVAATWAHGFDGVHATGVRLEPGVEVGITLRL